MTMPAPADPSLSLAAQVWRATRRLVVFVIGSTVLLLGVLGIILPGVPAIVLLPAGFAILATEFVWARRLLRRARQEAEAIRQRRRDAAAAKAAARS